MTEVSFSQVEAILDHPRQWLADKLTQPEDGLLPEDLKIGNRIKEQLTERATGCLEELEVDKSRYNHLKEAISGKQQRTNRGLIDAGGSPLNGCLAW